MADSSPPDLEGALSAFREGDMPRAIEQAQSALAAVPGNLDALRIRAAAALRLGRETEALRFADEALHLFPDDVTLLNVAGNALRSLGDLEQSATALRHALRVAPGSRDTQLNLAFTFAALGYAGDAEALLDNVVLLGGDSARTRTLLGRLAFEDGRGAAAETHLRRALGFAPDLVEAQVLLAEILCLSGQTEEALGHAERACAVDGDSAGAQLAAARAAFELCDERAALRHLGAALALNQAAEPAGLTARTGREWRPGGAPSPGIGLRRAAQLQWLNYAPPRVIPESSAADHDFPQPFSRELFVADLSDVILLPGELLPLTTEGALLVEGFVRDPFTRIRTSPHVRHMADDGRLLLAVPECVSGRASVERACLLGSADDHFTWVYECLSRLWIAGQFEDLAGLPLVTGFRGGRLTPWQHQLLGLLGVGPERIIEPEPDASTRFNMLHALSNPVAGLFVAPMAIEFLRRRLRPPDGHAQRRLYVSREGLNGRQLANEAEIWPLLAQHGFERIVPRGMDMRELLQLLASAAVVLGAEGAPMAQLFVVPRGATVGVLTARGAQTARYYCAAAPLGLDFCYVTAEPVFESNASLGECDLRLDPKVLDKFLCDLPKTVAG